MADYLIGLTGGIGSGKTTVANLFASLGIEIIDADLIARDVVAPESQGLQAIIERFSETILTEEGQLDRRQLRDIIFAEPTQREWLNQLLHPLIRTAMLTQAQQASSSYAILVVPLLFENGFDSLVDRTLVIDVEEELQISRTQERDQVSQQQVAQIIASQLPRAARLAKADDVIQNQGDPSQLMSQVQSLHQFYLQQNKE